MPFDFGLALAEARERPKQLLQLFFGHADAAVFDDDVDLRPGVRVRRDRNFATLPVVLDRVGNQVEQHLAQALMVGFERQVVARRRERHPVFVRLGLQHGHAFGNHRVDCDRLNLQRDFVSLDPHDVERLVDQAEQVLAGKQDLVEARIVIPPGFDLDQVGEAEYRVERRLELVAHARQELRLGAVGAFGFELGFAHGLFGLFLFELGERRGDSRRGDIGQRFEHGDVVPVETVDLRRFGIEHADDLALGDQRHRQFGPAAEFVLDVARIGGQVGDVFGLAVERRGADDALPERDRDDVLDIARGRVLDAVGRPLNQLVAFPEVDDAVLEAEHLAEIGRHAPEQVVERILPQQRDGEPVDDLEVGDFSACRSTHATIRLAIPMVKFEVSNSADPIADFGREVEI